MNCQKCNKPATVHLTEIAKNNQKHEKHLCEQCAAEEGVKVTHHMPINELLTNFVMAHAGGSGELASLKCDECGITFSEFRQNGLLGCPSDYELFEKQLVPLLERAHGGNSHHVGKVPSRAGASQQAQIQLLRLRKELKVAVENENYEQAAQIRDQINKMEQT